VFPGISAFSHKTPPPTSLVREHQKGKKSNLILLLGIKKIVSSEKRK
jgi:hypothetical protein